MRQELLTPASTGTCPPPGTAGLPRGTWGAWSVGSGVRVPLWGRAAVPPLPPAPPGSLPSAPGVLKARRSCRETRSGLPAREGPAARSGGTERSGGDSSGCPWAPTAARSEPQLLPGIPGGLRSSAPSPHPGASGAAPRPSRPSPCPCQPTASPPNVGSERSASPSSPRGGSSRCQGEPPPPVRQPRCMCESPRQLPAFHAFFRRRRLVGHSSAAGCAPAELLCCQTRPRWRRGGWAGQLQPGIATPSCRRAHPRAPAAPLGAAEGAG